MKKSACVLIVMLAWLIGPVLTGGPAETLADRAPGKSVLITPVAGAQIPFTNRLEFAWSQANRALKYTVFVGKDGATFTNVMVRARPTRTSWWMPNSGRATTPGWYWPAIRTEPVRGPLP